MNFTCSCYLIRRIAIIAAYSAYLSLAYADGTIKASSPKAKDPPAVRTNRPRSTTSKDSSDSILRGLDHIGSGFKGADTVQKNELKSILKTLSEKYYKVKISRQPETDANTDNPDSADIKVFFTVSVDSQAVFLFLKKMEGLSKGDSHQDFKVGGEHREFKVFEQNRLWMLSEYFHIQSKRTLGLLSRNKLLLSQEITLQVETDWDDLLFPPITWIASHPINATNTGNDPLGSDYTDQKMSALSGIENNIVFFNVPQSIAKKVTGAKIIPVN